MAVFNPGANVNFPLLKTTTRVYFKVREMTCFADGGAEHGSRVGPAGDLRGPYPHRRRNRHPLREGPAGREELAKDDGLLKPDDITANYVHLHKQSCSAWTMSWNRLYMEKW